VTQSKLLVVEDDAVIGQTIVEFLERAGYAVVLVADGDSAVAATRQEPFDLVISDVVLGSRDGNDVVEALLAIQPRMKVLFMSGYAAPRYGSTRDDPILAKPFERKELVERVEQLLAAG
jgi:DNA-binding response OmpR family regulator